MLDEFCAKLSDKAQLQIALRLSTMVLPVWERYFDEHSDAVEKLNRLIKPENRVGGGAGQIGRSFPDSALRAIGESYERSRKEPLPVVAMKKDRLLVPYFATGSQPLTNSSWDDTFPYTTRLVFTSVWNILTWILLRRNNAEGETHIYIAINQAADVLLSEKILDTEAIDTILMEYKDRLRAEGEDRAWEQGQATAGADGPGLTESEIHRKIIGENIVKDPAGELAVEVLRQMREEGRTFWDRWEEYYSGTSKTYYYEKERGAFCRDEVDVVAASFFDTHEMTEEQMLAFMRAVSLFNLRENGFLV